MSIQALFEPNNYNLYSNSVTIGSGDTLNYYKNTSIDVKYSGPFDALNGRISISRIGNLVSLRFNSIISQSNISSLILIDTQLPPQYVPSARLTFPIIVYNKGDPTTGILNIDSLGVLTIGSSVASDQFGNNGNVGFDDFVVSYIL